MPWLVVGGVLAIYFLMTRPPAAPAPSQYTATGSAGTTGTSTVPLSAAAKAPTGGVVGGALSTINNISNAGCTMIASSKGVPSGLASTGCKVFSYLTPIGAASAALKYGAPAVTYVGAGVASAAEAVGGAVATGAKATGNAIESGAKSAYNAIASIF